MTNDIRPKGPASFQSQAQSMQSPTTSSSAAAEQTVFYQDGPRAAYSSGANSQNLAPGRMNSTNSKSKANFEGVGGTIDTYA